MKLISTLMKSLMVTYFTLIFLGTPGYAALHTKLLIHSDGGTEFTDSSLSDHSIMTNGNILHSTTNAKMGSTGIFFDGSTSYLELPDHDDFSFGAEDFTIDFWININDSSVTNRFLSHTAHNVAGKQGWNIGYWGALRFTWSTDGSNEFMLETQNLGISDGTWGHIAIVRNGSSLKVYANGIEKASTDIGSASIYNTTENLLVGVFNQSNNYLSGYTNGYMDEIRISKGKARWTSDFLPPVSPYVVEEIPDNVCGDEYTKLLIHSDGDSTFSDSSNSNHSIMANGNVSHLVGNAKLGSTAIFFDGSTSYLELPDHDDFSFGAEDFTIDFWMSIYDSSASNKFFSHTAHNVAGKQGWNVGYYGALEFTWSTDGSNEFTLGTPDLGIADGTWGHIAIVRNGSNLKIYANGIEKASTDIGSASIYNTTENLLIGVMNQSNNYLLGYTNGLMDEIRISKGIARWTKNFVPPSMPVDQNIKLLLHSDTNDGDTTFIDKTAFNHQITPNGNVHHSTNQSKFGDTSIYFDGSGDYLSIPNSEDFAMSDEYFTIDFWMNTNALPPSGYGRALFGQIPNLNNRWQFYITDNQEVCFYSNDGTTSFAVYSSTITTGQWYHVAFVKQSNLLKIYLNGQLTGTSDITGKSIATPNSELTIGYLNSPWQIDYNGYIDELRISKGVAKWTDNFKPSEEPYTLELPEEEINLNSGLTITEEGNVGIGTISPMYKLDVNGIIRGQNVSPSDIRLKTNILTIDNALTRILNLRGVNFNWKESSNHGSQLNIGVIAQEVEKIFPEAVMTDKEGYKAVSYDKLVAPLIEAVKELKAENEGLKQKLEVENKEIMNRIEALENK